MQKVRELEARISSIKAKHGVDAPITKEGNVAVKHTKYH